jgi:hypothetical protein
LSLPPFVSRDRVEPLLPALLAPLHQLGGCGPGEGWCPTLGHPPLFLLGFSGSGVPIRDIVDLDSPTARPMARLLIYP